MDGGKKPGTGRNHERAERVFGPYVLDICTKADIVFLALHGANGEDGKVQSVLDLMGIPLYRFGSFKQRYGYGQRITKVIFEAAGVPTPKGVTLEKKTCTSRLADYGMDFPVIVKPCCGGSSVGVCIAKDQKEYEMALAEAFSYENEVVVEQFIQGREFFRGSGRRKGLSCHRDRPFGRVL